MEQLRVAIVHNRISADASEADRDVLIQAQAVEDSLRRLGHEAWQMSCDLDLAALQAELSAARPDLVFNLAESVAGSDWLAFFVPALLDRMGLPHTGSRTLALLLTNHKLMAKQRLRAAGLSTPDWVAEDAEAMALGFDRCLDGGAGADRLFILKTITEHASVHLDETGLVRFESESRLRERLRARVAACGRPCFAEAFIEGREFNVPLIAGPNGPEVLPVGEIDFSTFPADKARIVDYKAKWDEQSFEYHNTPRHFDFPAADEPLLRRLRETSLACWRLFGLNGYVRVDYRVDAAGTPWILEVNANPCLSPDAGYAAAMERGGLTYDAAVRRIVADALPKGACR